MMSMTVCTAVTSLVEQQQKALEPNTEPTEASLLVLRAVSLELEMMAAVTTLGLESVEATLGPGLESVVEKLGLGLGLESVVEKLGLGLGLESDVEKPGLEDSKLTIV
jgi:hypothetical protein